MKAIKRTIYDQAEHKIQSLKQSIHLTGLTEDQGQFKNRSKAMIQSENMTRKKNFLINGQPEQ